MVNEPWRERKAAGACWPRHMGDHGVVAGDVQLDTQGATHTIELERDLVVLLVEHARLLG